MRKYGLLIGTAVFLAAGAAAAEDYTCATPPTCAELGYDQTASDCAGKKMVKCPFDQTKVFCGGDCEAEGYTKPEFSLSVCCAGKTKVVCPYDSSYFKCEGTCLTISTCTGYTQNCICLIGQTKEYCASDSSYCKCTGSPSIGDPVEVEDSCSSGFLDSSPQACACTYGIKANGMTSANGKACYRCGTYSECGGSTGTACLKCATQKVLDATL